MPAASIAVGILFSPTMILERSSEKAAAYATLGVVVEPQKATHSVSEKTKIHFLLGATYNPVSGGPKRPTAELRAAYAKGKLSPTHSLHRLLLTSENRRCFIAYLENPSLGFCTQPHHGATMITYAAGHALPGIQSFSGKLHGAFTTKHLRSAVALITAGHTLLAIDGNNHSRLFYLTHKGPEGTATDLINAWLNQPEILPAESVFLHAIAFLHNREHIVQHVNKLLGKIILAKPHDPRRRSIEIPENASGKTWDKAKKFLLGH